MFKSLFDEGQTLGGLILVMLSWSCFYLILSWYFERIWPGEFGVKLPFYFPFMVYIIQIVWKKINFKHIFIIYKNQKSYWFESNGPNYNNLEDINDDNENDAFEREPTDLYASVKIRNLTKVFLNINHENK